MSVRSRIRTIVIAGGALLGVAGVVVVATFPPTPNNLALDCRISIVDGGRAPGQSECIAIVVPPHAQCGAVMATGGEPPGAGLDAGFPNASVRVERALEAIRTATTPVIETWHCESATVDAGAGGCFCELRANVVVNRDGTLDGQAPALHDVIDAQGVGSIFVDGSVTNRPSFTKRSGCRAHVFAGEDPCAGSVGFDAGPDPSDAGP